MNLESDVTCVQVWIGTISFLIFRLDDRLTCVDHPAIMEEGDSEYDLTYKGFDRLSGTSRPYGISITPIVNYNN